MPHWLNRISNNNLTSFGTYDIFKFVYPLSFLSQSFCLQKNSTLGCNIEKIGCKRWKNKSYNSLAKKKMQEYEPPLRIVLYWTLFVNLNVRLGPIPPSGPVAFLSFELFDDPSPSSEDSSRLHSWKFRIACYMIR